MLLRMFVLALCVTSTFVMTTTISLAEAANRGPSTKEERAQAVAYARMLERKPFGLESEKARNWLKYWVTEVPDLCTHVYTPFLNDSFKMEKRYAQVIVLQAMFSSMAYVIENLDTEEISRYVASCVEDIKNNKRPKTAPISVGLAGLEGALAIYESILKTNPSIKSMELDKFVRMRDEDALKAYIDESKEKK